MITSDLPPLTVEPVTRPARGRLSMFDLVSMPEVRDALLRRVLREGEDRPVPVAAFNSAI